MVRDPAERSCCSTRTSWRSMRLTIYGPPLALPLVVQGLTDGPRPLEVGFRPTRATGLEVQGLQGIRKRVACCCSLSETDETPVS